MEIIGCEKSIQVKKILVACKYSNIKASVKCEKQSKDILKNEAPDTLPALCTPDGVLFQTNAILRFIGGICTDSRLYGNASTYTLGLIDQWLDFAWGELEVSLKSYLSGNKKQQGDRMSEFKQACQLMDSALKKNKYLAGEFLTIADISVVMALSQGKDSGDICEAVKSYTSLYAYFTKCLALDAFVAVLGGDSKEPDFMKPDSNKLSMVNSVVKEKFSRHRIRIKDLLLKGDALIGETVVVSGWAKTLREAGAGSFAFLELNDGSCFSGIQTIVSKEKTKGFQQVMESGGVGASFKATGTVLKSPAKGQAIEIDAQSVVVYGVVLDKAKYPMSKKRHTLEHLRAQAHLRPRSNIHGAAMRVRNAMAYAIHKFYNERGFLYIHTPLITASDCEGAGEMFGVTTMLSSHPDGNLPKTKEGKIDFSKDFFSKPAYLTVSGQLNVETHSCALSDVYTFGPTFRAENSNTTRHLAEFWMIEPEIAFGDLNDNINLAEDMLKYCAQYALDNCADDVAFFDKNVEKGLIKRLESTIKEDFIRITYTDAVELLCTPKHLKAGKFTVKPEWGIDLGSEHERYLTETVYKRPVCIYNYPKDFKAFYMRLNDDEKTVAAVDILVPKIGEIIGGAQREERLDVLNRRIVEATGHDPSDYAWYTDLRKYGTVPHAGFGLGFERLVRFVTGIENIRDVIPFPRWPGNADF